MINYIKNFISNNIYYFRYKSYLKNLIKLKKLKKNKNVIVLGNGDSVNLLDPKKILKLKKNFDVIATNTYFFSKLSKVIIPDYYLISDRRVLTPNNSNFTKQKIKTCKLSNSRLKKSKKTILLLPAEFHKINQFSNQVFYFNNLEDDYSKNSSNLERPRGFRSMSGLKALSAACYLGYKKIYFCGIDFSQWASFKVNDKNIIYQSSRYFFSKNNIHKNTNNKKIYNLLKDISDIYLSQEIFNKEAIVNLNPYSLNDVFSKKHKLKVYK